jgi:protein SCO1
MNRYSLLILVVLLQACTGTTENKDKLPYYVTADFTPHWLSEEELQKPVHQIPSFSFINQSGQNVTEQTVQGKIYVASFFFTSCPGICKRLTNNISLVQEAYKENTDILILSHSVTPETDSVTRLNQYALQYRINQQQWHLLTGKRNELYSIARKSYFADEDLGAVQAENDFLHTENVLLIDKQRRIRGVYKGTSEAEIRNLIIDIKRLQEEG